MRRFGLFDLNLGFPNWLAESDFIFLACNNSQASLLYALIVSTLNPEPGSQDVKHLELTMY